MTRRGRPNAPERQLSPLDPTLSSRPVPQTRAFTSYSVGPGSRPDVRDTVRTMAQLDVIANPQHAQDLGSSFQGLDDTKRLLEEVEACETVESDDAQEADGDPTWGFYIFVTTYSENARQALPDVIEKIVGCTKRRTARASTLPPYRDELLNRFRLEIIEDEEALSEASYDRVQQEFMAMLRGKNLITSNSTPDPPARNFACLMLDEETVTSIANFEHDPTNDKYDLGVFVKVVDVRWQRPAIPTSHSTYRGWGRCPLSSLDRLYLLLTVGEYMEDMHPLEKGL